MHPPALTISAWRGCWPRWSTRPEPDGLSPSFFLLLSWLNCSVNSVSDSSMVSVRGTERENLLLKFFILFIFSGAAGGWQGPAGRRERGGMTKGMACLWDCQPCLELGSKGLAF